MAAEARKAMGIGNYDADIRGKNNLFRYNGVKQSYFPHAKRDGISSILDSGIKRGDALKNKDGLGDGAVTMFFRDEKGAVIKGEKASMTLGGLNFSAREDGSFRLVDEAWLDEEAKLEQQKRDYVDEIVGKMLTDEIFEKTLGIPNEAFMSLCKSGGSELALGIPQDIDAASALPSVLDSYVPGSQMYLLCLSKQRAIIKYFMPVLQKKSETKSGEVDAKDAYINAPNV